MLLLLGWKHTMSARMLYSSKRLTGREKRSDEERALDDKVKSLERKSFFFFLLGEFEHLMCK